MPDDQTTTTPSIYRSKLHQIYEIPKHDELVQGAVTRDHIEVDFGAKDPARGMLLMLSGTKFVPATSAGVSTATELCICANDFPSGTISTDDDGDLMLVWAYFSGTFKASSIILPYEGEDDDHDELLEAIKSKLRTLNFYLV